MTQSLLRLWYKLILKRHNLRETVVPIHLDFMWSLSTLNLEYFPPSCSLWSEKEGWNLKGRCRSSGREKEREWEAEVRHAALFKEFFFNIKAAVGEPRAQEGARWRRVWGGDGLELLTAPPIYSILQRAIRHCLFHQSYQPIELCDFLHKTSFGSL